MKRIYRCFCLAVIMLLSCQAFSQNLFSATGIDFVPAKVTLVGDGFEITSKCEVHFDVDTLYNTANFMVRHEGQTSDMINYTIEYMTCSEQGLILHMDLKSLCVMEKCGDVTCCKLTINDDFDGFDKVVFLFYIDRL